MPVESLPFPRFQRASRWLGWVLVAIHTLIAAGAASNFGKPGSEWWPIVFFPLDFPVSLPVFLFFKNVHSFGDWGTLSVFIILGTPWHFYWPQTLAWLIRRLAAYLRPKAESL